MTPQLARELAYEDWLAELTAANPGGEIIPTRYGAEIRDADGYVIAEPDYDAYEPDEASFHY